MSRPSLFFQLFHNPNDPRFKDKTWQEREYAQDDLNGMMPFTDEELELEYPIDELDRLSDNDVDDDDIGLIYDEDIGLIRTDEEDY